MASGGVAAGRGLAATGRVRPTPAGAATDSLKRPKVPTELKRTRTSRPTPKNRKESGPLRCRPTPPLLDPQDTVRPRRVPLDASPETPSGRKTVLPSRVARAHRDFNPKF